MRRRTLAHRRALIRSEEAAAGAIVARYRKRLDRTIQILLDLEASLREGGELSAVQVATARKLRGRLKRTVRRLRNEIAAQMQGQLADVVASEADAVPSWLRASLPTGARIAEVPAEDLAAIIRRPIAGQDWGGRLDGALLGLHDQVDAALAAAVGRGASMERAVDLLQAAVGQVEGGRGRLERLARTEIQRASNDAALSTYRANRDVLSGVMYLATLDSRVCTVCQPRHEQVYPLDDEGGHDGPPIPQHPYCRCFYAPVPKTLEELGLG